MENPSEQHPLTLLQLSGIEAVPSPLEQSVILVVDAQKEYTEGCLPLHGINKSIEALSKFLDRARKITVPIIHIQQIGKPGGKICNPDGPFVEIIDAVKPADEEIVVQKNFPNSFTKTTLSEELDKIGRKNLIITGYMTHMCVNSTTRAAAELGYQCTLISELTATRDLPDGKSGIMKADLVKEVNLASLADRFAIVVDTANYLK